MAECKYQHGCEVYEFCITRTNYQRCKDLIDICELERSEDISEACDIYRRFENPLEFKPKNKKSYLTKP